MLIFIFEEYLEKTPLIVTGRKSRFSVSAFSAKKIGET